MEHHILKINTGVETIHQKVIRKKSCIAHTSSIVDNSFTLLITIYKLYMSAAEYCFTLSITIYTFYVFVRG